MFQKTLHHGQGTAAGTHDGTTHVGVNGGRNTTMTVSSGIVAGVPSANVAMVTMGGITIGEENEAVVQIAIVTAVGTGVGIAIVGMIGPASDEIRGL
jgi:hypothetical protein